MSKRFKKQARNGLMVEYELIVEFEDSITYYKEGDKYSRIMNRTKFDMMVDAGEIQWMGE